MSHSCDCGHATYGAHLRSKNLSIGYCGQGGGDATSQKRWDKELNSYYGAVAQGVEPQGTSTRQIRDALDKSDKVGIAYDASNPAPAFFGVEN